ncbi:MAG: thioredoxin family protein [Candidatus Bipolaricaulota bacterium]
MQGSARLLGVRLRRRACVVIGWALVVGLSALTGCSTSSPSRVVAVVEQGPENASSATTIAVEALAAAPPAEAPVVEAVAESVGWETVSKPAPVPEVVSESAKLPRLVDLGASTCIPCREMAPILEELGRTHKAYFEVVFIDVRKTPSEAREYGIRVIPTQIFYDADGRELFRHVGFYSKAQILAKWRALGVDVGS